MGKFRLDTYDLVLCMRGNTLRCIIKDSKAYRHSFIDSYLALCDS